jgi:hypothetical protein
MSRTVHLNMKNSCVVCFLGCNELLMRYFENVCLEVMFEMCIFLCFSLYRVRCGVEGIVTCMFGTEMSVACAWCMNWNNYL